MSTETNRPFVSVGRSANLMFRNRGIILRTRRFDSKFASQYTLHLWFMQLTGTVPHIRISESRKVLTIVSSSDERFAGRGVAPPGGGCRIDFDNKCRNALGSTTPSRKSGKPSC